MFSSLIWLALLTSPTQTATPPVNKTLFAEEKWYKDQAGDEKTVEGVLMITKGDGRIGLAERFNGFRVTWLEDGKPMTRQLFTNGKDEILAPFLGNIKNAYTIKITGKLVDDVGGNKVAEFWPAKLEVLSEVPYGVVGEIKILAKAGNQWYLNVVRREKDPKPYIFRDGKDLVPLMGYQGVPNAEQQASQYLSQLLRLPNNRKIDWNKEMAICLTGGTAPGQGVNIEISRVAISESGGLDVFWKYSNAYGGGGISYPIETILVPRTDEKITLRLEGGGADKVITVPALEKKEEEPKKEEPKKEEPKKDPPKK